jgi:hypothetical protein
MTDLDALLREYVERLESGEVPAALDFIRRAGDSAVEMALMIESVSTPRLPPPGGAGAHRAAAPAGGVTDRDVRRAPGQQPRWAQPRRHRAGARRGPRRAGPACGRQGSPGGSGTRPRRSPAARSRGPDCTRANPGRAPRATGGGAPAGDGLARTDVRGNVCPAGTGRHARRGTARWTGRSGPRADRRTFSRIDVRNRALRAASRA